MRTKALLCAAGVLAAAATSMAQSNVYSLNVVGYINNPYTNGFQLVANQLHTDSTGTNDTLQTVFGTNVPNPSTVYTFTPGSGYAPPATLIGGNWSGATPTVNAGVSAGRGVWLKTPGNGTYTTVGEVKQGTTPVNIAPGFNIVSLVPPLSIPIQTGGGYPAQSLDTVYRFTPGAGYQSPYTKIGASWSPSEPTPNIGEAFWLKSAASTNKVWNQTYTVPQ